ncbi:MAG: DUF262 domain-containing protein [Ignavibacteria bacterium]
MGKIDYEPITLKKLKEKFDDREFAIPQIQRKFVWTKKQVCDLMDSIYNHIPIGVFLTWKTQGTKTAELRPNSNSIIPPFNYSNKYASIIIDGQQRLSTIYGIIKGITPQEDENANIDFTKVYFNTETNNEKKFSYKGNRLSSDYKYVQLTELLVNPPNKLSNRYGIKGLRLREIIKCRKQFLSYKYYSLIIETKNQNEVKETFIRVNSKGMTVSSADILFARTTKIGLRDRITETRRSLKHGFNKINEKVLISTIALIEGEKSIGQIAIDNFEKKFNKSKITLTDFKKNWKKIYNAFTRANDYLADEFKITSLDLLPSENIFTMLSLFFYYKDARPSVFQKTELKKWFWNTSIGERYSGANFNRNIKPDIEFIKSLAKGRNTKYQIKDKIDPTELLQKDYKSRRSTAVRAFFLLLKNKKPRYIDNGEEMLMEIHAAISNRRDKHHIFPRNLLNRNGIKSKWVNSISNICYLASDNNQSFGSKYPVDYLKNYRRKKNFRNSMISHLIPLNNPSFWTKNLNKAFKDLIKYRGKLILSEFEKLTGVNKNIMFHKFDGISRIN